MIAEPSFVYVDDDAASRKVIEVLLKRVMKQNHVTIFEDSADLIARLSAVEPLPNIFFLDIQMQPLDGFAVLKLLRAEPRYAPATILAMTANVMAHDVERLKQAGFDGLIGKPILHDSFPHLIERILDEQPVWFIP